MHLILRNIMKHVTNILTMMDKKFKIKENKK